MLRPTESPTLFLQQLGRGLRRRPDKAFCTVLDFVGTHRKEFRFDRRYRALLGGTRRDVERAVQLQFPFLPAGCNMQLDQKASRDRAAQPARSDPVTLAGQGRRAAVAPSRRSPTSISPASSTSRASTSTTSTTAARAGRTCSEAAGAPVASSWPERGGRCGEPSAGCSTSTTTSASRTYRRLLAEPARPPRVDALSERERRLAPHARRPGRRSGRSARTPRSRRPSTCCGHTRRSERSCSNSWRCSMDASTTSTLRCRRTPDAPLQVHARYSRIEILAAFGIGDGGQDRRVAERRLRGQGPPTPSCSPSRSTRAAAASPPRPAIATTRSAASLIHWESQSITRADSPTGLRYRNHERDGRVDPALHPAPGRRPRVLVPRPGHLPRPRRREADGDHLGARRTRSRAICTPQFAAAVA